MNTTRGGDMNRPTVSASRFISECDAATNRVVKALGGYAAYCSFGYIGTFETEVLAWAEIKMRNNAHEPSYPEQL